MPSPALPTNRIDCTVFPNRAETKKSVVSRPRPLSLLAFGSRVAKRNAEGRPPAVSDSSRIFVAMTMSSTSWVVSPSKLSSGESGAAARDVIVEPVVKTAVDLQFGDRADAEAHAERREPQQVPLQARRRIEDIVLLVEAAFEQHQSRADGLGIFGHERALLRSPHSPRAQT